MGGGASAGGSASSGGGASGRGGGGAGGGTSGAGSGRGTGGDVALAAELGGEIQEGGREGILVDGGGEDLVDSEVVDAASEARDRKAVSDRNRAEGVGDVGAKTADIGSRGFRGDPEVVGGGSDGGLIDESKGNSLAGGHGESVHFARADILSVLGESTVEESSGTKLASDSGTACGTSGDNATIGCGRGDDDDNNGIRGREGDGVVQVSREALAIEKKTLEGVATLIDNRDTISRNNFTAEGTGVHPGGKVSNREIRGIELDNRVGELGRSHAEEEAKSDEDGKLGHYGEVKR